MKPMMPLLCVLVTAVMCAQAQAVTLSFDDIPAGGYLGPYISYNVWFSGAFRVADHSASLWGPPRSGNNVLVNQWSTPLKSGAMVKFGYTEGLFRPFVPVSIRSFSGYFSTELDVVVRIVGLHGDIHHPVASAFVGAAGESWSNRYVEIASPTGDIDFVMFYNVSSDQALFHYCADDVTVEFVPEPSALTVLSLALAGAGIGVARRRR